MKKFLKNILLSVITKKKSRKYSLTRSMTLPPWTGFKIGNGNIYKQEVNVFLETI